MAKLVTIKIDEKKLRRIQLMLKDFPSGMNRVMPRAINKTAASGKTQIVREIVKEVNIKQKAIRRNISIDKATRARWMATVWVTGKRIPLINFAARQTKTGISYMISRSEGRKKITYDPVENPVFITTMKTGHKGVYKRKGEKRLPITELMGPSIPVIYSGVHGLSRRILKETYKKLNANIDTQIQLLIDRRKGAAA